MRNLTIFSFLLMMVILYQSCSIESKSHFKIPHEGWYQDPMNPKYALKKYNEGKPSADTKHGNLIK